MEQQPTVRENMTKRQRLEHYLMTDVLKRLEYDLHRAFHDSEALPDEWEEIATRPDQPKKKKITMRVDEDVLKFFRVTGRGYLTRMNDVLRAYMHSRLSGVVVDASRFERWVDDADRGRNHADAELERLSVTLARQEKESALRKSRSQLEFEREIEAQVMAEMEARKTGQLEAAKRVVQHSQLWKARVTLENGDTIRGGVFTCRRKCRPRCSTFTKLCRSLVPPKTTRRLIACSG